MSGQPCEFRREGTEVSQTSLAIDQNFHVKPGRPNAGMDRGGAKVEKFLGGPLKSRSILRLKNFEARRDHYT